jgi:beta-lactamase class D
MRSFSLILLISSILFACTSKDKTVDHPEFESYFKEYQVEGCFLLFDFQNNKTIIYNEERCSQGFLPASTFKMVNTLIGLETGIITGEDFVIPWDSVSRQIPAWNRDHKLQSAFQNSVVPWYQELARRIGTERMQLWVSKTGYGKMDISAENIDLFWLTGNSRITPLEQLGFQKHLIKNELPFSQINIDLLKEIMILEETQEYVLRGKTGWAVMNEKNIGWLVGYLEKGTEKYAYVINVESADEDTALFVKSRIEITRNILKKLGLI